MQVANEGYDGLKRGDRIVVPGSDNKMIVAIARLLPRSAVLWLVRFFQRKPVTLGRPIRRVGGEAREKSMLVPRPLLDRHRPAHQHHVS